MSYNFVNQNRGISSTNPSQDKDLIESHIAFKENRFILKHNIDAIVKFVTFLNSSSENIFILNGFMGSGKTYTADVFLDFVSDDVLVFRNSYQEAINLDDVLLSLFKDFSVYHNEKKIVLPKVESSIFSEKINAYIKNCNAPMLFIFDSFEINTRSIDTQKDILDFITYLSHFEKIKILICSRSFKVFDLQSDIGTVSHTLESITKEEMINYLDSNSISGNGYEIDELYKEIRGHYILLELSVLIMNLLQMDLIAFSTDYKKSTRNFLDFLISKLFVLSSEKFIKILIFLALIRHGISEKFIIERSLATEEDISYLLQKHIVSEKFGLYYLKDYIKNHYTKGISPETKVQVHQYLIGLYEDELPLKPFERELFLSRQTMRQEIAYHKNKIEKINEDFHSTAKLKQQDMKDFNYITYSQTSGYNKGDHKTVKTQKISNQRSSIRKNQFELSKDDSKLLNLQDSGNLFKGITNLDDIEITEADYINESIDSTSVYDGVPKNLNDYINIASKYEDAFNFASAILYYKKSLTYKTDYLFSSKEPIIYTKLAICYKRLQNYEEAVQMYEKAYSIYYKDSIDKANEILLSIAQIYNEVYKFDKVREIYNRILYSEKQCSPSMLVRAYLDLFELENNNLDLKLAATYLKKALVEAEKLSDVVLLAECYFKYALFFDDRNDLEKAQKYYLRCIQTSNNPLENQYLSSAYVNIAEISIYNKNINAGKMYYELAVDADKKADNNEALFYSYSKLAELYIDESSEKRYEYLVKALSCAKRFDDISYAVSIYVEIGDYYFENQDYRRSLKSYILAKRLAPAHISDKVNKTIDSGINRIKMSVGEADFFKIAEEIKKKSNV